MKVKFILIWKINNVKKKRKKNKKNWKNRTKIDYLIHFSHKN